MDRYESATGRGRGSHEPRTATIALGLAVSSAVLLGVMLLRGHTTGGEIWGLVAAGIAILGGALTYRLAAVRGTRIGIATASLLWVTVAVLGVGGALDHAKALKPTYVDQRGRPALVPLVFTAMGLGGLTLVAAASRPRPGRARQIAEVEP